MNARFWIGVVADHFQFVVSLCIQAQRITQPVFMLLSVFLLDVKKVC
jgi:hypothetical protein